MAGTKDAAWWRDYRARKKQSSEEGGAAQSAAGRSPVTPAALLASPKHDNAIDKDATKDRARALVNRAVASGRLVRGPCHCGNPAVDAHHPNGYDAGHELDVIWLCGKHHIEAHGRQKNRAPAVPTFLAAPDDDCLLCDHDRQAYHLSGPCTFPVGRRRPCACPAFLEAF